MKKSLIFSVCCLLLLAVSVHAEPVATGKTAPEIPVKNWLDTKTHNIAEFKNFY